MDIFNRLTRWRQKRKNMLFTLASCMKCRLAEKYMRDREMPFTLVDDMTPAGERAYRQFYLDHKDEIVHTADGYVPYPIFWEGHYLRQGICRVLAFFVAGTRLDDFFSVNLMRLDWIDGIHVSAGRLEDQEVFLDILRYLKENRFKLRIDANGKNSVLLRRILAENLADTAVMEAFGPPAVYGRVFAEPPSLEEVLDSMALIVRFPQYTFQTSLGLAARPPSLPARLLTEAELEATARLIRQATGGAEQPWLIRAAAAADQPREALLALRAAARKHQALAEIDLLKGTAPPAGTGAEKAR